MPARNIVPPDRQGNTIDVASVKALHEAGRVGLADIDGGRYRSFETSDALRKHLAALTDRAIGRRVK